MTHADLFVPPAKRMQGIGKLCLERLHGWASKHFDLIYGIAVQGEGVFRAVHDWKTRLCLITSPDRIKPYAGELVVRPILLNELDSIVRLDNELLKEELLAQPPSDRPRLAIKVDARSLRSFIELAQYNTHLDKSPPIDLAGWQIGEGKEKELAFIIVAPKLSERALLVQRIRVATPEQMHALLHAAATWCRERDLFKIRCHGDESTHRDMLELTGVAHEVTEDAALSVQWLDPTLAGSDYDWPLGKQLYLNCTPISGVKLELATLP